MNAYHLSIESELFETRNYDEDGEMILREVFFLRAEAEDGSRWVHVHKFVNHNYTGRRSQAMADAERFMARVQAAMDAGKWNGPVDNDHWYETSPCYGSWAYAKNADVYAAADCLADGDYAPGSMREYMLREKAATALPRT